MRKIIMILTTLLMLVPVGPSQAPVCFAEVSPSDDAYHYGDFRDGSHDANYIEWWYFNLFDHTSDIQIIFYYSIINPDNILDFGITGVGATVFTSEGIISEMDTFSTDLFYASEDKPLVEIGDGNINSVKVIDNHTYHIVGCIADGRIKWDLMYAPQIDPWFAAERKKVGRHDWEQMSWLVYMPGAYVTGNVVIDGETRRVDHAPGYHDHNWGEWIPYNVLWNWVQYFEPGVALEVGDFRFKPVGVVSIEAAGQRTVFEKDEYALFHTRWMFDSENRKRFPVVTWLLAENEKKRLIVRIQTLTTESLMAPLKIPLFLPDVLLYEQTASYFGRLWDKNHQGVWELSAGFEGNGFKEYSVRIWDD
ncbi:MAG: hypothetical protein PVF56_16270 [Desulfobacterales bacterium]|jgi:hypothetical protein